MWPALFTLGLAIVSTAVAASQVWPAAKRQTELYYGEVVAITASPVFWTVAVITSLTWLIAFVWSGKRAAGEHTAPPEALIVHDSGPHEDLSGYDFALGFVVRFVAEDMTVGRLYVFSATDGTRTLSLHFTTRSTLAFRYLDSHGEEHTAEAPISRKGIPLEIPICLVVAGAVTADLTSELRIFVNGELIVKQSANFPTDFRDFANGELRCTIGGGPDLQSKSMVMSYMTVWRACPAGAPAAFAIWMRQKFRLPA